MGGGERISSRRLPECGAQCWLIPPPRDPDWSQKRALDAPLTESPGRPLLSCF